MLIVLVILVIAVAYYMGKNSGNVLKDVSENLTKETQKQNEKVAAYTEKNADVKKEDNTKTTNAVISKCGFSINSPALNSSIYSNTPLTFSGVIDNTNYQTNGCRWTMFEGQAGTAQLYYKNGNTWGTINTAKIIKVTDWMTAGPVPFTVVVSFNNTGPGFPNNTPMKVVFTEDYPSGATPDTLEFSLIFKTNNQIISSLVKGKVVAGDCMPGPDPKVHNSFSGKIYFIKVADYNNLAQGVSYTTLYPNSVSVMTTNGNYSVNLSIGSYFPILQGIIPNVSTQNIIDVISNQPIVKNLDICTSY